MIAVFTYLTAWFGYLTFYPNPALPWSPKFFFAIFFCMALGVAVDGIVKAAKRGGYREDSE